MITLEVTHIPPCQWVSLLSSRVGRYPTFTRTRMDSTPIINTYLYGIDSVMYTPASSRQRESVRLQTGTKIGKPWKYRKTCEIKFQRQVPGER